MTERPLTAIDRPRTATERLQLNAVACDGVGICSHIAVDLVRVDSWGYPIVSKQPLTIRDRRQARAAVAACPRRALFITTD